MNHIKKALEETNNNIEEAKIWLKKKGFKDAENRMTRTANTKLYGLKINGNKISSCLVSCETDFVAETDMFKNLAVQFLNLIADSNQSKISENEFDKFNITEGLKGVISKTQENCKVGLLEKFAYNTNDILGIYLHSSPSGYPNLGQKAAFVVLSPVESANNTTDLNQLATNLAMQVVACKPKYLNISDVPKDVLAHETKIITEGVNSDPKLAKDSEKIIKAKLNNWYEENVLNEQDYVIIEHDSGDKKLKVKDLAVQNGVKIIDFKLFA